MTLLEGIGGIMCIGGSFRPSAVVSKEEEESLYGRIITASRGGIEHSHGSKNRKREDDK